MRQIHKNAAPIWFEDWKKTFVLMNGRNPHYLDLTDSLRIKLRGVIVQEQGNICCYCMRRINQKSSHIEHYKPRDLFQEEDLSYDNMFASCPGQPYEVNLLNQHCDSKKNNWYDERFPKPTDSEFEKCISYRINGFADPYHKIGDDRHSLEKEFIEKVGLNAPYLIRNRRQVIEKSEIMDEAEYSNDDWMDFISYYDKMHEGNYEEYCAVIIDIIRRECITDKE